MKRLFAIVVTGAAPCAGKKGTLLLSSALVLLLFSVAANARTCLKVDDENSPATTVSGRVTLQHRVPKSSESRAAKGPFLILDQPLFADIGNGCREWRKIAITSDDSPLRKWEANQDVTIKGKLNRFGSALVDPPIFIEVTTIKKK